MVATFTGDAERSAASHCFCRQRTDDLQSVSLTHSPELMPLTRWRTLGRAKNAAPRISGTKSNVQRRAQPHDDHDHDQHADPGATRLGRVDSEEHDRDHREEAEAADAVAGVHQEDDREREQLEDVEAVRRRVRERAVDAVESRRVVVAAVGEQLVDADHSGATGDSRMTRTTQRRSALVRIRSTMRT